MPDLDLCLSTRTSNLAVHQRLTFRVIIDKKKNYISVISELFYSLSLLLKLFTSCSYDEINNKTIYFTIYLMNRWITLFSHLYLPVHSLLEFDQVFVIGLVWIGLV